MLSLLRVRIACGKWFIPSIASSRQERVQQQVAGPHLKAKGCAMSIAEAHVTFSQH